MEIAKHCTIEDDMILPRVQISVLIFDALSVRRTREEKERSLSLLSITETSIDRYMCRVFPCRRKLLANHNSNNSSINSIDGYVYMYVCTYVSVYYRVKNT